LSALESWSCVVHRHRTGLDGEAQRRPVGSSDGYDDEWDPGGRRRDEEDDDDRRRLLDVMNVADRAARLDALRRYLAAAAAPDAERSTAAPSQYCWMKQSPHP